MNGNISLDKDQTTLDDKLLGQESHADKDLYTPKTNIKIGMRPDRIPQRLSGMRK